MDTLITLRNIGHCLLKQCKYNRALEMFQQVVEVDSVDDVDNMGDNYIKTLEDMHEIGFCFMKVMCNLTFKEWKYYFMNLISLFQPISFHYTWTYTKK